MSKVFWDHRYFNEDTPWDVGEITTPIKEYIDQLTDKNIKILIPGVGNGYELEYLFRKGFNNIFGLDISRNPIDNFLNRVPDFPEEQLFVGDFFDLQETFDLVLEQTFFCALPVENRLDYARKMASILNFKGKLVGLLFQFPLTEAGPPFGGNREEYLTYFDQYFDIDTMDNCYNSIKPRIGKELFISLIVK